MGFLDQGIPIIYKKSAVYENLLRGKEGVSVLD